jgi:hypothetical protein
MVRAVIMYPTATTSCCICAMRGSCSAAAAAPPTTCGCWATTAPRSATEASRSGAASGSCLSNGPSSNRKIDNLALELVRDEGPGILQWLIEGARRLAASFIA